MPRTLARAVTAGATLALAVALAGCTAATPTPGAAGGVQPPKITELKKVGKGEGALNIIAWAGYAEDGSSDPKVDWVTPF